MQAAKRKLRNAQGSGIVEGVAGLSVLILTIVAGSLLILNVGIAAYYKSKVGSVANQAAARAASIVSWSMSYKPDQTAGQLQSDVTKIVNSLLVNSGLPKAKSVQTEFTKEGLGQTAFKNELVKVTVVVDRLPLFGGGDLFPKALSVQDTAMAVLPNDQPPALVTLSIAGNPRSAITIPSYGKFRDGFSNGSANPAAAPVGTAVFMNFRKSYAQFSMDIEPVLPGETDPTGFSEKPVTFK
jgi:hypothetical protein